MYHRSQTLSNLIWGITNINKIFPEIDYDGLKKIARSLPYQTLFVKPSYQVYNRYMSPRHFAAYAKRDPKDYNQFSDNMWNGFVSVTKHIPIVNRFFSFTPADLPGVSEDLLDPRKIGRELGKVYKEANPDTKPL